MQHFYPLLPSRMIRALAGRPSDHLLPIHHGNFYDLGERLFRSYPLIGGRGHEERPSSTPLAKPYLIWKVDSMVTRRVFSG
jgi:hypothetical protein